MTMLLSSYILRKTTMPRKTTTPRKAIMPKKNIGLNEILTLSLFFIAIGLFILHLISPEYLHVDAPTLRAAAIFFGLFFCYFTVHEIKSLRNSNLHPANRIASAIRVPLYGAITVFLFYFALTESSLLHDMFF